MSIVHVQYRPATEASFKITFGERGYDDMTVEEARALRDELNAALGDVGGTRGLAAQVVLGAALNYADESAAFSKYVPAGAWLAARAELLRAVDDYRKAKAATARA